jgi:hypothetical protein
VRGPATFTAGTFTDTFWKRCLGPYERAGRSSGQAEEPNDSPCYRKGDTHGGVAAPNLVTGCDNFFTSNGDLDYDGTSYWPNWPSNTTPNRHPSPFVQQQPRTQGVRYPLYQFQTNSPASESTCQPTGKGCAVPAPGSPGHFYPWWTLAKIDGRCVWEFGQMTNGKTFGRTAQYGKPALDWFFGNLEGPITRFNGC